MLSSARLLGLLACFITTHVFAATDSVFPLWKAPDAPDIPAYSVSVMWYQQAQDYRLDQLTFTGPGGLPPVGHPPTRNRSHSLTARPGLWLFPFLRVFGVLGHVTTDTTVSQLPVLGQVNSHANGTNYGGGINLVYGRGHWFGAVDLMYSRVHMNNVNSVLRTQTVHPRIGRQFSHALLWVGAMYQRTEEVATGAFPLAGVGNVPFRVKFETADPWNAHVGGRWNFNRHVGLVAEAGFAGRSSLMTALEFAW